MAPAEASQAKSTVVPLTIGVAVVTRILAGVAGGGSFTVNVKVEVLLEGDPSTVDPVTVIVEPSVAVGVWADVPMVNVDVQVVGAVALGVHEVGEKLVVTCWLGRPLTEKETLSAVPALLVTVTMLVTEEPWATLISPLLARE